MDSSQISPVFLGSSHHQPLHWQFQPMGCSLLIAQTSTHRSSYEPLSAANPRRALSVCLVWRRCPPPCRCDSAHGLCGFAQIAAIAKLNCIWNPHCISLHPHAQKESILSTFPHFCLKDFESAKAIFQCKPCHLCLEPTYFGKK